MAKKTGWECSPLGVARHIQGFGGQGTSTGLGFCGLGAMWRQGTWGLLLATEYPVLLLLVVAAAASGRVVMQAPAASALLTALEVVAVRVVVAAPHSLLRLMLQRHCLKKQQCRPSSLWIRQLL